MQKRNEELNDTGKPTIHLAGSDGFDSYGYPRNTDMGRGLDGREILSSLVR